MLSELIKKNRSYRRFDSKRKISTAELREMIEAARCSASAANRQRIRFALVNDEDTCAKIFDIVGFAGYLKDWAGPLPTERPVAYVVMMCKEEQIDVNLAMDMGIAAQSILLTATEMGLGGCMIRSFKKAEIEKILSRDSYNAGLVIALGAPSERVYLTEVKESDIKYYRDENDDHVVPKYSLDEIII